jgi:cytochrome c oxidase subunit 1
MMGYLIHSVFAGRKAKQNEWGGATLDWRSPTPPPLENFDYEPEVTSDQIYDYSFLSEQKVTT